MSNTVPWLSVPYLTYAFPVGVLNLGAALNVFVADRVALRREYRFQRFRRGQKDVV